MTASPIAPVRVFKPALPTLSVRDRAIIVLNHHRFWGYASGPSSSGNTLPSSIHGHAARRSALPRERFSPLALLRHAGRLRECLLIGEHRKRSAHGWNDAIDGYSGTDQEQQACTRDVQRFCHKLMDQGDFTILACLKENRLKPTPACRDVLISHGQ